MEPFKYFTREGNVYIKKPQKGLYYSIALLLFVFAALAMIYGKDNNATKVIAALLGLFGLILLLRAGAVTKFDTLSRTIAAQNFLFRQPQEFRFEDFQNFLISKQTLGITINATATMIMDKNGKRRNLLLHQTMFITRPLQKVTEEAALIMGLAT